MLGLGALTLLAGLLPWWRKEFFQVVAGRAVTRHITIDGYSAATAWTVALVLVGVSGLLWVTGRRLTGRSAAAQLVTRAAALAGAVAALLVTGIRWAQVPALRASSGVRVSIDVLGPAHRGPGGAASPALRRDQLSVGHVGAYSTGPAYGLPLSVALMVLLCVAMVTALVLRGRSGRTRPPAR